MSGSAQSYDIAYHLWQWVISYQTSIVTAPYIKLLSRDQYLMYYVVPLPFNFSQDDSISINEKKNDNYRIITTVQHFMSFRWHLPLITSICISLQHYTAMWLFASLLLSQCTRWSKFFISSFSFLGNTS